MRFPLAIAPLLSAGCDDDWPGVWANGEPFAECRLPPAAPTCGPTTDRTFTLAVCGSLTADNTLDVRGPNADVALWVQRDAVTRAPLRVEGAYWSATNQASNTQSATSTMTGTPPPACSWNLDLVEDPRWNVRIDEPANVVLEGCSYAQPSLDVDNTLDVHIRGDVTWVIESDLRIAAPLNITLDSNARLTWIIGGRLDVDNTLVVAGPTTMMVAGPIHIAAPMELEGSLIAPNSRVDADNTLSISGAAYVGDLRVAAPMRVDGSSLLREDACVAETP